MVKCCAVCQDSQAEHRQQPLLAHDVPSTPWTKVASDMFQIKGDNYLLVTDYHSKFYLVEKMHSTTSSTIANKSAQWFSMFGPSLEIVANGPQYVRHDPSTALHVFAPACALRRRPTSFSVFPSPHNAPPRYTKLSS